MSWRGHSLVYWHEGQDGHRCGYCKSPEGSVNNGMTAETLTVEDYQDLIDRGWRRSGHYVYKPAMSESCCPAYTIKCDTPKFALSKSQKKVIKRLNKFLKDGEMGGKASDECGGDQPQGSGNEIDMMHRSVPRLPVPIDLDFEHLPEALTPPVAKAKSKEDPGDKCQRAEAAQANSSDNAPSSSNAVDLDGFQQQQQQPQHQPKSGVGADPDRPKCKKAKLMRLEKKKEKLLKRGMSLEQIPVVNEPKSLEEFLAEVPSDGKHKFRLQLVNVSELGEDFDRVKDLEFELYKKYQIVVHGDPPTKPNVMSFRRFLVLSPLQTTVVRMKEDHELFETVYDLYVKYQEAVHGDDPDSLDVSQFCDFLVVSPLQYVEFSPDSNIGFGSFHQLYWLDDKLIAVGVIDILPKCVSAVYFFYDPDYRSLTLGTYGSLREIELARSLNKIVPSLQYYYMGFYIHSCPKMRYKGKMTPSYLLCPETFQWVPIERCLPKLDASKYSRLVDDLDALDDDLCSCDDLGNMRVVDKRRIALLKSCRNAKSSRQRLYSSVGALVGKKCIRSIIFINI